jgi:hypothetical protein
MSVTLTSSAGVAVATANGTLDNSGDWTATLKIPQTAVNGTYFMGASVCRSACTAAARWWDGV